MTETTYTVPGAPRLALLSDLHGRPYREIIVSASLSNTASPIPRLKESSPAYHSLTGQEECHVVAFGTKGVVEERTLACSVTITLITKDSKEKMKLFSL